MHYHFKIMRIIDTWIDTVPGIGRVMFHYDLKYMRCWAERYENLSWRHG